jgi:hypothetical protein
MSPETLKTVEWCGSILGVTGSMLVAANMSFSRWGWWFFLASNVAWIAFAHFAGTHGLLTQQLAFTASSVLGIVRSRKAAPVAA